jgi:ankyrin repeat protein
MKKINLDQTPTDLLFKVIKEADNSQEIERLISDDNANYEATDENGNTLLHLSTLHNYIENVRMLLVYGSNNVNAIDKDGNTALHIACLRGQLEVVKLLLGNAASIDAAGLHGDTALRTACKGGHLEVVKLLLKKGTNINAANIYGETALHTACLGGHLEVLELLLENGANIDAVNNIDGNTALYQACEDENLALITLLIKKGANIDAVNDEGNSVLGSYPQYFNKQFLLPIFEESIDKGDTKALVNLCKYAHYRVELARMDQDDTDQDSSIVEEFHVFLAEYNSIPQNIDKIEGLNHIIIQKFQVITTTESSNSRSIGEIVKFLTGSKEGMYQNRLNIIPGIPELIMSYLDWQKQWSPILQLRADLLVGQTYQSIDDISILIKARSTDISVISNINLDPLQQEFKFSNEIKQTILANFPSALAEAFTHSQAKELFAKDYNKAHQFILLKLIAKALSYDITYYSDADSIIHFSGDENAIASFKIYETPERQLIIKLEPAPQVIEAISLKNPHDDDAIKYSNKALKLKSEKANSYSYSDILIGLKILDASADALKVAYEPTSEHFNVLLRDAVHLGIMLTGTGGYLTLTSATDIEVQLYNGEYKQAFIQAGTTAGYMLLPTMLGTSLAPILVAYTGYKVANNIYSIYSNYNTPEAQLKSNLAYATLESNLGLQDLTKESLINAIQIVRKDFELYQSYESSIQQIAAEYNLTGKICELNADYNFCQEI